MNRKAQRWRHKNESRFLCPHLCAFWVGLRRQYAFAGWRSELSTNRPTPQPLPGGEQTSGRPAAVPLLGGVRGGFTAPMRDFEIVEAFHKPPDSAQRFGGHRARQGKQSLCPPKLCAETGVCQMGGKVHGSDAHPLLEVEAPHESSQRSGTDKDGRRP